MKKKKKSQIGYRVAAGIFDVFGVAAASVAIVVLMLMLGSLYTWLKRDLTMTFSDLTVTFADLTDNLTDAVIITDHINK